MADLPVEEAAQIRQVCQLEGEQLAIESQVVLVVLAIAPLVELGVVNTSTGARLHDQHLLATVDNFVELALGVAQLVLLRRHLKRLSKLAYLTGQVADTLDVSCILHLQVIVFFNQGAHLLLKTTLVHGNELVFEGVCGASLELVSSS